VSSPGIQLGENPHRLLACRQCNRDCDSGPALGLVVVRALECERCRRILPPCEVKVVFGLDARHKRRLTVIGDGRVNFPRRIPNG
jgi:hypothetical protein